MFSKSLRLPLFGLLVLAALTMLAFSIFSSSDEAAQEPVALINETPKQAAPASDKLDDVVYFDNVGGNILESNSGEPEHEAVISTGNTVIPVNVTPSVEASPSTKGQVVEYTIQAGDMISRIALKFGCKSTDIYNLNSGIDKSNAHKIRVGQTIQVIDNKGIGGKLVTSPEPAKIAEAVVEIATSEGADKPEVIESRPTPVVPVAPKTVASQVHIFKRGETYFTLAKRYYGTISYWKVIKNANPQWDIIDSPSGIELLIPALDLDKGEVISTTSESGLIPARR